MQLLLKRGTDKPKVVKIQKRNLPQMKISQLDREQAKFPIGTQEYMDKSLELKELRQVLHEQKFAVNDLGNSWKSLSD